MTPSQGRAAWWLLVAVLLGIPAIWGSNDIDIQEFSGVVVSDSTGADSTLYGRPIANAAVTIRPCGRKRHPDEGLALQRTTAEGYFTTFYPPTTLPFLVRVEADGYPPQTFQVRLRAGRDTRVRIVMGGSKPSSGRVLSGKCLEVAQEGR